ncbi:MAG: hypothetical protein ACNYPH_02540 [Gammaproteobacteria bacterium WSBS_2016_MAG_OTU1]
MNAKLSVFVFSGFKKGVKERGLLLATNAAAGRLLLVGRGVQCIRRLWCDPVATFLWQKGEGFDKATLAQLFNLLGRNVKTGVDVSTAFLSCSGFVGKDRLLRSACMNVSVLMKSGEQLALAMKATGFSTLDVEYIKAMKHALSYSETFISRAETLKFEADSEALIRKTVMPLLFFTGFIVVATSWVFLSLGPQVVDTMKEILPPKNITGWLKVYINTMDFVDHNRVWLALLYWSGVIVFVMGLVRSSSRNKIIQWLLPAYDKFKKELDQYRCWQLWDSLSSASMPTADIFNFVEKVVADKDIKVQAKKMAKDAHRGRPLTELISDHVVDVDRREQLLAVFRGSSHSEGVGQILEMMKIEIAERARLCAAILDLLFKVAIGLALAIILLIVVAPTFLIVANVI